MVTLNITVLVTPNKVSHVAKRSPQLHHNFTPTSPRAHPDLARGRSNWIISKVNGHKGWKWTVLRRNGRSWTIVDCLSGSTGWSWVEVDGPGKRGPSKRHSGRSKISTWKRTVHFHSKDCPVSTLKTVQFKLKDRPVWAYRSFHFRIRDRPLSQTVHFEPRTSTLDLSRSEGACLTSRMTSAL